MDMYCVGISCRTRELVACLIPLFLLGRFLSLAVLQATESWSGLGIRRLCLSAFQSSVKSTIPVRNIWWFSCNKGMSIMNFVAHKLLCSQAFKLLVMRPK